MWSGTIACVALRMLQRGDLHAAIAVGLSEGAYLRQQDLVQLGKSDIYWGREHGCVLALGIRERGERSKTGSNQGVLVDRVHVSGMLRALDETLQDGEPFFVISAIEYRRAWWAALQDINGHKICGPPHSLRRSGPSAGAAAHRRTLEEIRRRGRRVAISSVQRYAKYWTLSKHMAKVPPPVRAAGEAFLADPRKVICAYLAERKQPLARRLERHLARSSRLVFPSRPPLAAALEPKAS